MERVWAVFQEMLQHGIQPSVVTYNVVIDACARSSQMDKVPGLLEDMRTRKLEANLITYSTVIKGHCQCGDLPSAFMALEDFRQAGARPDEVIYNTLLEGCSQANLVTEGEKLFEDMEASGVVPSNFTLTLLVRLLSQGRRLQNAFDVVTATTKRYRFRANMHVWGALVQACLSARDIPRAADAFDQAVRERAQPDPRVCQHLVRSLFSIGYHCRAEGVFRGVLNTFSSAFDDSFCLEVVTSLANANRGESSGRAAKLLADLSASRPKMRVPTALEQK